MSVRFIYGRAGSGKSHFCFQDIKRRIDEGCDGPLILLVPEDFSFQAEKDLLRYVGERGLLKAKVLSFKRMAYSVFNEVGGLTKQHMNSAGKAMIIYKIMDEVKRDLKVFSKAVSMQGFVDTMADIITELKIYNVNPEILADTTEKIEEKPLKDKLHDIGLIYSKFDEVISENYIDSDDDLILLAQKLDKSSMFNGAEIWIDGFSLFNPQQYMIIEKLLNNAKRVNITLCTDITGKDKDVFSSIDGIEKRIINIARDNNISIDEPVSFKREVPYKFRNNRELGHLEKNLLSFPYDIYEDKTRNISIFKAMNKYTEVENTARDIVRLTRDEGIRYSDIAVVTRDTSGYEYLIEAIFTEYGIPYFLDRRREISSSPIIILALSAIEILSKNWSYESVFKYLKTGLVGIPIEDIDLLENYALSSGIKGKRWTVDEDWKYWPRGAASEEDKDTLDKINEIRRRVTGPILELQDNLNKSKNVKQMTKSLFEFLCAIGLPERVEGMIYEFKDRGDFGLAGEYSGVWNTLIEVLDQAVEVLGEDTTSVSDFVKILSIGFGEYNMGLIPPSVDQVMFGGIERIKSHNVSALYILGVNDGVFPSPAEDEGILSDSDRQSLKSLGIELAPDTREKIFNEQFLIYTTFTRTEDYLYVSYPIADHEGRAMRPSILISRFKKIFKNISEHSDIIKEDTNEEVLNLITSPTPTFNELISAVRLNRDGDLVNTMWKDVYSWYMKDDIWRHRCERALSGINYKNEAKRISKDKINDIYGKQLCFSISRLERYSACPFAYFVQYGLKAKERDIYEFTPPDVGSFIHTILDRFSTYLDENNLTWREVDSSWCNDVISDIVDKTVEEEAGSILSSSARYRYLKNRLKRVITRAVYLIALHIKRGGFNPAGHEVSFEDGGKYPPISINLPSGENIKLIGRIDRVDTLETEDEIYVRVVDYKTGNKSFDLSDIYNGLELQLLVYLDAILEYASKNSKKPVLPGGILYFRIDDPMIKTNGEIKDEEIENEIMKSLKMKGLLLSDVKVIREMDKDIDGYSIIIPAMIKADGGLGSSSSVADEEKFDALRKHVKDVTIKLCEDMLKGNIMISPYKNKDRTPCSFCTYKAICRFDVSIKENTYRIIRNKSKDEIWETITENTSAKEEK